MRAIITAIISSAAFAIVLESLGIAIYKKACHRRERKRAEVEDLYSIIKPALDNPAWHYILYEGITECSGKTKLPSNEFSFQWALEALIRLTENPQSTLSPEDRDPSTFINADVLGCVRAFRHAFKYPDPHTSEEQRIALKIFLEGVLENYQTNTCAFRERYVTYYWDPKDPVMQIKVDLLNQDIRHVNEELGLHLKPLYEEEKEPKKS